MLPYHGMKPVDAHLSKSCKLSPGASLSEPWCAELSTADLAAVKQMDAAAHWDTEFFQYEKGALGASVRLVQTETAQVVENIFDKGVIVRGGIPKGCVVLGVLAANEHYYQGMPVRSRDVVILRSTDEIEYRCKGPSRLITAAIEESQAAQAAEACWGVSLETLCKMRLLKLGAGRRLGRLQHELNKFLPPRNLGLSAGATTLLDHERLLALLFRYLQPPAGLSESFCFRQRLAGATEEYLRSHSSEPISTATLCRELGARERTLYLGFRERYGMSPHDYMAMLRMNAAREALLSAPSGSRVSDIALSAGFTHIGRFSIEYRKHFGELPSETLSRDKQRART